MVKKKKEFYFSKWEYTKKDFQKWGRKGGLVFKYASAAERQRAYRRRKAQTRIDLGLITGVLNLETGRVRKYRNGVSRQSAWRERKKLGKKATQSKKIQKPASFRDTVKTPLYWIGGGLAVIIVGGWLISQIKEE